jgi:hypothetical protein
MRTPYLLKTTLAMALSALLVTGCKKESSQSGSLTPQEEAQVANESSESDAEAEAVFNDVFDNVIGVNAEVGLGGTGIFGGKAPATGENLETGRVDSVTCFTVTTTRLSPPNAFPVKVEVNFGAGCVGRDGRKRSGKVITVYTGRLITPGSTATTTFDKYRVDSFAVEGTHRIANTSTVAAPQFTIDVQAGKLIHNNGNYTEYNSHRVKTQVEGVATPLVTSDDAFRIEGQSNGKTKRSAHIVLWRSEIVQPLIKRFNCRWIVRGVVKVRRKTLASTSPWVSTLDYGNGSCDRQATLTINGVSRQIILH